MIIDCQYHELVSLDVLKTKVNPKNRNKHNEHQVNQLAKIMLVNKVRHPIVISNQTQTITKGHGRLLAADVNGWKEFPVQYQDYDNPDLQYADEVADNAIAMQAELDLSGINLDLPDLGPLDLDLLGIKDFVIEPADKYGDKDADSVPESRNTNILRGDLFQLGVHRVLCGDSTSREDVERLMNGEVARFSFTSPPYSDQRDYKGDLELSPSHLAQFLSAPCELFAVNLGIQKKDHEIIPYWNDYLEYTKSVGLKLLSWNVWDKAQCGSVGQQTMMFPLEHEWIFVFGHKPRDLNKTEETKWGGTFKASNSSRNKDGTITKTDNYEIGTHKPIGTVIRQFPEKARNHDFDHPAMFPVAFPEKYILACTKQNESVFEPFSGSGSTLIACEKTNRKCFGLEIDPQYCQVIIDRWEKFTGQKAQNLEC